MIYLRDFITEVWELENGKNNMIKQFLPGGLNLGIALYAVDVGFCKKQP